MERGFWKHERKINMFCRFLKPLRNEWDVLSLSTRTFQSTFQAWMSKSLIWEFVIRGIHGECYKTHSMPFMGSCFPNWKRGSVCFCSLKRNIEGMIECPFSSPLDLKMFVPSLKCRSLRFELFGPHTYGSNHRMEPVILCCSPKKKELRSTDVFCSPEPMGRWEHVVCCSSGSKYSRLGISDVEGLCFLKSPAHTAMTNFREFKRFRVHDLFFLESSVQQTNGLSCVFGLEYINFVCVSAPSFVLTIPTIFVSSNSSKHAVHGGFEKTLEDVYMFSALQNPYEVNRMIFSALLDHINSDLRAQMSKLLAVRIPNLSRTCRELLSPNGRLLMFCSSGLEVYKSLLRLCFFLSFYKAYNLHFF